MVTIHTQIIRDDYRALVKCISRAALRRCGAFWVLLPIGIGVVGVPAFSLIGIELHFPSFCAGLGAGVIFLMSLSYMLARKMRPAEDGYILGPQRVELTEAGLRVVSQRHEAMFRWDGVRSVELTGKHIFVMVDQNAGIIVPCRSFASDADREQFVREVQEWRRGAPV